MGPRLRLAFTADLHWGINARGDEATRLLVNYLQAEPPDVLVLAGDVGAAEDFAPCLQLFAALPGRKALVPGNHDIWVRDDDARGDSLQVYQDHLPRLCTAHGFHYLDQGPLLLDGTGLSLVGSMNWYDYSWSLEELKKVAPDWETRLQTKRFSRGRHNDVRFVRWPLTDVSFTARSVATFDTHLGQALDAARQAIVVTHHPPFYGLSFPRQEVTLDTLLWDAFGGNRALEAVLARHAEHIPFAFCGHTHRARENQLEGIRGCNIGGDYHFKRLLVLDWPAGTVEAHQFGDPEA
jgi:3',5'-cyclic AMP phosphodiesterase CpdA